MSLIYMSYRPSELARRRRRWSVLVTFLASCGISDNADESGRTPSSRGSDLGRRCSRPPTRAGRTCNYGITGPKSNFIFFYKLYECSFRCTYEFYDLKPFFQIRSKNCPSYSSIFETFLLKRTIFTK